MKHPCCDECKDEYTGRQAYVGKWKVTVLNATYSAGLFDGYRVAFPSPPDYPYENSRLEDQFWGVIPKHVLDNAWE